MSPAELREKGSSQGFGVLFLLYKDGLVLVEERLEPGSWGYGHMIIPGGKIKEGEHPIATVAREVEEELGVQVTKMTELESYEDISLNGDYCLFHPYLITEYQGEVADKEPGKKKIHWLSFEEARKTLKLASSLLVLSMAEKALVG